MDISVEFTKNVTLDEMESWGENTCLLVLNNLENNASELDRTRGGFRYIRAKIDAKLSQRMRELKYEGN